MGFDWEEILDSADLEEAWYDAVYDAAQATGGWQSAFAKTFWENDIIDEDFLLDNISQKTAKNGNPYFVLTLQRIEPYDTIKGNLFSANAVTEADIGKTVHVRGTVVQSKGNLYLKISHFALPVEEKPTAPAPSLAPGSKIDGRYTLQNLSVKVAANGNAYLSGILQDDSGRIPLRVWNYTGNLGPEYNGKAANVKGTVTSFRDVLRVEVEQITLID